MGRHPYQSCQMTGRCREDQLLRSGHAKPAAALQARRSSWPRRWWPSSSACPVTALSSTPPAPFSASTLARSWCLRPSALRRSWPMSSSGSLTMAPPAVGCSSACRETGTAAPSGRSASARASSATASGSASSCGAPCCPPGWATTRCRLRACPFRHTSRRPCSACCRRWPRTSTLGRRLRRWPRCSPAEPPAAAPASSASWPWPRASRAAPSWCTSSRATPGRRAARQAKACPEPWGRRCPAARRGAGACRARAAAADGGVARHAPAHQRLALPVLCMAL
mmetsp:Transcript_106826/g.344731  ORF Transcript_106826/g.344731 Transcript_106826/m.344731 type:complete len:281 (-) Transcript_106826:20-862(-)